jgi:6-pyruvoyltetrahydropterin/6-carboxytetrahydropterin synthase
MHGHGFEVILHVDQDLAGADMGIDFDRIAALWAPLHAELDHACLNDIPGWRIPPASCSAAGSGSASSPCCRRCPGSRCTRPPPPAATSTAALPHLEGAALRVRAAPGAGAGRRPASAAARAQLSAAAASERPLDEVLGWTVDYGDVKALFKPIYERSITIGWTAAGPAGADPAGLAVDREQARASCRWLERIDLQQTPGCGAPCCAGVSSARRCRPEPEHGLQRQGVLL